MSSFAPARAALSSSCSAKNSPPSPSAATVIWSGSATAAPIAPARPSPTAWKPFMKTQWRASSTSRNIAGQPMKCPESIATVLRDGSRSASAIEKSRGST